MSMTWLPMAPSAPPPLTASLHQLQSAPNPGCGSPAQHVHATHRMLPMKQHLVLLVMSIAGQLI